MPGTISHKQDRILALDGLRGILALTVTAYHFLAFIYGSNSLNPLHHAYLAVDFFFLLSGFVIGRSYDFRWPSMNKLYFFKVRLIRLHPMVLIGLSLGILEYFGSNTIWGGSFLAGSKFMLMVVLQIFLLPSPDYIHDYQVTHPLNSPMWSLFQEYLVNITYGLMAGKLTNKILLVIVASAALMLVYIAIRFGNLGGGWDWYFFWVAPFRACFSFFAGLYIYRCRFRLPVRLSFPWLAIILALLLITPIYSFNGIFDAFTVLVLFPLLIIMATYARVDEWQGKLCQFAGKISYPVYLIHYPVADAFWKWLHHEQRSPAQVKMAAIIGFIGCILFSWLVDKFLDKPIRAWLCRISATH